jgi:hypothetical protein
MTTLVACSKCTHATGFVERPRLHACFSVFPNLIVITLRPSTQSFSSSVGAARHEVLTPPKYHDYQRQAECKGLVPGTEGRHEDLAGRDVHEELGSEDVEEEEERPKQHKGHHSPDFRR